jgi:aromatic-L-amino-acid decarboxylase
MTEKPFPPEETLDPADWEETRRLAHRMVDDTIDSLASLRERAPWQPVPLDVRARLAEPLPEEPQGLPSVYQEFVENVRPYPTGNLHPRFWGWVKGTGTVDGMLAEMLAAAMNCNVSGFDDAATLVENETLDWCKSMLGYPREASGLFVSGGSMANLVGLAVARQAAVGARVRTEGLAVADRPLVLYASCEAHSSVRKAVELLGLGSQALRAIDVNDRYEIDLAALAAAVAADRAAGAAPFCVVANVGTVNTGAIDDLERLADFCARERLWLHVDGAFGVWAALSSEHRPRLAALARADSLAFDLHKWLYVPYEVGCALVRSAADHHAAFSFTADYLTSGSRGADAGPLKFSEYGVQLSRGFRALKVWMTIKAHGRKKLARLIEQNLAQAQYLAARIDAQPELERLAPVPLNIVCFRYVGRGLPEGRRDALNREILHRLHEDGIAVPSSTLLDGSFALRVAITNHRSRREDFDLLVGAVIRLGRTLVEAGR